MIGKLTGLVDSQGPDFAIIDVNGVGYVVSCSPRTLSQLPGTGEPVSLAIETQMREDSIRLFGFSSAAERDWFRLLQGVQGVGSKVALAILGVLPPSDLTLAIGRQDKVAVARAPGVGPKLAARIVAELKDKTVDLGGVGPSLAEVSTASLPRQADDAVSALVNLGYGRPQVIGAVAEAVASLGPEAATAVLIRQGLKLLSS
ncbi:Holliday junction branch migration protein RuvA [Lichenifustis flavocetrariae]|uniref:Holliday junction branch migration complex subunit RuvA n=1 Tax=Lichenifustis flavocetrariae TaxID=2949735 RepID=A0AA42CH26_9HYPH|nr:Holliday junction branch migration protein RuvA [Lichenifustis flavocetrariae]MCW6506829.1 Holliday junction branch migration protein RuvA [Lichenifustis flavocetrariae]